MAAPHVLVVANRTCPCPGLHDHLVELEPAAVHVIAPALASRLQHWMSDTDEALRDASARLADALTAMRDRGLPATGEVGDAAPLLAIDDALAAFAATELVISSWPQGRSHWLEKGLPQEARRFGLPITHLSSPYGLPVAQEA